MRTLGNLTNETRARKPRKRVGRGAGSGTGKTSGRGHKGAGARSGYERRLTYEGGQMRLFLSLPQRGFSRARFQKRYRTITIDLLNRYFQDGDVVDEEALRKKGLLSGKGRGVKVLAKGTLERKLQRVEVNQLSAGAKQQLENMGVEVILRNR